MTNEELLQEAQRGLMISVATGGPQIKEVNQQYVERRTTIRGELFRRGIEDPNPFSDLWEWYGKWSDGEMPRWQDRRVFIKELYQSVFDLLRRSPIERESALSEESTGWDRVDRAMNKMRQQLELGTNEEDYQQIGLLGREILISLAQAVYDPSLHPTVDGTDPSPTDAKRMLEAYIMSELEGGSNQAARKHARASLDLANDLQHRRTATFRSAALCAEASTSLVNIIAIISGRRNPDLLYAS